MVPYMAPTGKRLRLTACVLGGVIAVTTLFELVNYLTLHDADVVVVEYPSNKMERWASGEGKGEDDEKLLNKKSKTPAEQSEPVSEEGSTNVEELLSTEPDRCNISTPVKVCLPGFLDVPLLEKYLYDKKTDLMTCVVNNNYSPYLQSTMCFLKDKERFMSAAKSIALNAAHETEHCKQMKTYNNLDSLIQDYNTEPKKWRQFAVVEDPIQRFAKAFAETCYNTPEWNDAAFQEICDKCIDSIPCFIERYYRRLHVIAEGEVEPESFDLRFIPQNWFCKFHNSIDKYQILQVPAYGGGHEGVSANLANFFAASGVKKTDAESIGDAFEEVKVAPKKKGEGDDEFTKALKEIRSNQTLMKMLLKLYYFDFKYFGYELPEALVEKQRDE
ncbi:hypothetical protein QR680_010494 [Steinernema hermaphroditum]|uniref:Uncharacterized protein n=1 Tax=Steinernema hermaphroditum TaxID=289476 RepID=A0AA39IQG8_9BILA|nr:hypothetical protein QR680_010494 [Steinernema hermaphroditum]